MSFKDLAATFAEFTSIVLSNLDPKSLFFCALVCKKWNQVVKKVTFFALFLNTYERKIVQRYYCYLNDYAKKLGPNQFSNSHSQQQRKRIHNKNLINSWINMFAIPVPRNGAQALQMMHAKSNKFTHAKHLPSQVSAFVYDDCCFAGFLFACTANDFVAITDVTSMQVLVQFTSATDSKLRVHMCHVPEQQAKYNSVCSVYTVFLQGQDYIEEYLLVDKHTSVTFEKQHSMANLYKHIFVEAWEGDVYMSGIDEQSTNVVIFKNRVKLHTISLTPFMPSHHCEHFVCFPIFCKQSASVNFVICVAHHNIATYLMYNGKTATVFCKFNFNGDAMHFAKHAAHVAALHEDWYQFFSLVQPESYGNEWVDYVTPRASDEGQYRLHGNLVTKNDDTQYQLPQGVSNVSYYSTVICIQEPLMLLDNYILY